MVMTWQHPSSDNAEIQIFMPMKFRLAWYSWVVHACSVRKPWLCLFITLTFLVVCSVNWRCFFLLEMFYLVIFQLFKKKNQNQTLHSFTSIPLFKDKTNYKKPQATPQTVKGWPKAGSLYLYMWSYQPGLFLSRCHSFMWCKWSSHYPDGLRRQQLLGGKCYLILYILGQ